MTWTTSAAVGSPRQAPLLAPDSSLQRLDGGAWKSSGERACFSVGSGLRGARWAAGWYRLCCTLRTNDTTVLAPCLYPVYASGGEGETQIGLPHPDANGLIDTLVLFKHDVSRLRFSPVQGASQFELPDFSLRKVGRGTALWSMLGPVEGERGGRAARSLGFARLAARSGLSQAADASYRDYLRRTSPAGSDDYAAWVARFDTLSADRMHALRERAALLAERGPCISILLPVYQTHERWLRRCIESVIGQVYGRWQLCIVDDASPDARVLEVVREYAELDSRIVVTRRATNGHIALASNTALDMANGEYIGLLDHDDELRPHALLEMAQAIVDDPDVALLYSDEDKLDASGQRYDPYFKPDFDPDLLRGQNYICHFTVVRTDLVRSIGGFRAGFEGSQDHDLVLRCTERLAPSQVRHVPKVLYHWRAIQGSTALSRDAKDYASAAGARAVGEHLERRYPSARVEELSHGHFRVHWPLPAPMPMVTLVIPTRDKVDLLRTCVESILDRSTYAALELLVVDNQSSDAAALAYLRALEGRDRVRVLRYDRPFNYSALNNWAVSQSAGDVIGLINNDIEVITADWLEEMVSQAVRPEVGAVGAMLYYPDDNIQHAGVVLGIHGVAAHIYAGMPKGYPGHGGRARVAQTLSAVTGACLLVRRAAYDQVGGLDPKLAVAFNDIDFCLRLRQAGYRNVWTPFAELYHHESASRGSEDTEEKKQRFAAEVNLMLQRWGYCLAADPAYNPNLSLSDKSSKLASPPRAHPRQAPTDALPSILNKSS